MLSSFVQDGRQEPLGRGHIRDERIGHQRPEGHLSVAGHRRLDGQLLVGLGVLDERPHLRGQGSRGDRRGTASVDARRQLHHRIVGEPGDGAVVAHIDHLDVAGPGVERGDELGGRFAVVRAAPLAKQLG